MVDATTKPLLNVSKMRAWLRPPPPFLWWLIVFGPALSYFGHTRWPLFASIVLQQQPSQPSSLFLDNQQDDSWKKRFVFLVSNTNSPEDAIQKEEWCSSISKLFHVQTSCKTLLQQQQQRQEQKDPFHLELSSPWEWLHSFHQNKENESIVASTWRHDAELGRGYLLLSRGNRVWRWERGGGPISIGLSLQLDHAGCRHDRLCATLPLNGVGGLTVDFMGSDSKSIYQGSLVMAEWGEGRIVRLEQETNGARTPLALLSTSKEEALSRQPQHLLMTPFGDLLYFSSPHSQSENCPEEEDDVIHKIPQAMTVPSLDSLRESRLAHNHSWIREHLDLPLQETLYLENKDFNGETDKERIVSLNGMTLTSAWTSIYVSATSASSALLYKKSIVEEENDDDDDDDDDDESNETKETNSSENTKEQDASTLIFNLTQYNAEWIQAGPIVASQSGHVFWVVNQFHLVLLEIATTTVPQDKISSSHSVKMAEAQDVTVLGYFTLPSAITSLSLGGTQDTFLYLTTAQEVYRLPILKPTLGHPVLVPLDVAPKNRKARSSTTQ